ncbi:putative C2H2 finger domain protein [Aspergillus lucknowensis]|uniref:C2H2-type domain-containing protein n=1 Tax=Aspergillus lucknowensis TaxID=176173 RepID=A0ABR4LZK5_9EURO
MSAVSPPQFVQSDPTTDKDFDPELSNLYLSTGAVDPEEAAFHSSGIRLTPVNDEDRGSTRNVSISPLDYTANSASTPGHNGGYGTSYSEFLSPSDDWTSDISGHTSPADLMVPNMWPAGITPAQNIQTSAPNQLGSNLSSPQTTMDPSQLLTPNLTNNPSPSSDTNSIGSHKSTRSGHHPAVPRLITTPLGNSLGPHIAPESATAISPIVKVESYSRGDSPVRDNFPMSRRPSQSSGHLSPGVMSNASEEDGSEAERRPISRAPNGAWIPDGVTGQSGLAPNARADAYIPSPNEMDSQRKLEERNADIFSWSEAVSEAHSDGEAGDEYLPSHRGRTNRHCDRPRAKSTGDPSLHQQDYFNLNAPDSASNVPGPGLVLREDSDISDDGTESSAPVSVNEERWTQDASEITPPEPQNAETGEPLPHQFLGTRPWRDAETDSTPTTTQNQPVSSTQAMIEYQRRALEMDEISRVATWGTREIDANSIKSFQMLSLNGKEKKHERRGSLLKYLPRKQSNLLKRSRQRTDLSTTRPGSEGAAHCADSRPAPQSKDSFPHRKLSLALSPKSPSYSTGGAFMAMTRGVAAVGGGDTLSVVSPSSTTNNPWASFKARGRSRSEVPRAPGPGLFELMTSHGGPPVPNISYSSQTTENEAAQRTGPEPEPEPDAAEDDGGEDSDEKGLVMEFPIPRDLPLPTFEGFRKQIIQLNPRLAPALVDRFSHEQVRRYRRLVDIKQAHARDVTHGKCKAGKFCFAQGGQAKLLPPRASAQDADAHTQFQIPGRGDTEESPEALGETTIATAQFPPGVPYPPSQVNLLPAEFECTVCFHVKKFQKPSDWTKHIYEDVQPFTCTFPNCTDPKSFKRKADWVRHESERHRQLEWWECSFSDCRHKCYRKDNFVQHLVREHKAQEPKVKKSRNRGTAGRGPSGLITPEIQEEINREREVKLLWDLVESCRHETTKNPREEPCRFCGNVCTNWKKLTAHLAKHMEQMAIPILGLVGEREFPRNNGARAAENTDTVSGQMLIAQEASDFNPSLNGVADGLGPSLNYTHAQYPSSHAGGSESHALSFDTNAAYIPATSLPMESATPNPLNNFESVSPYATHTGEMPGPSEVGVEQPQLMGMHQNSNSVSYPPPFNAGPRPRISNQELRMLPEYNNFSMSPTEMQYDPQNAVYVSSGAENHYSYHGPMASEMGYNPGGFQGQGQ